jgi:predicted enzyme related to lactoylglutathione lyase
MSDLNTLHNRAVWFDIPVADLDRAAAFYRAVLAVGVETVASDNFKFCVIEHADGNGGCLVPDPNAIAPAGGILLYLNVNGRMKDAVREAERLGGSVLEPPTAIGPHGFRAVVRDSEGNRIALHSTVAS